MPAPQYVRINVASVTSRTAPPYAAISHVERSSRHVLEAPDQRLLVGPLGVNYHVEGADLDVVYLRRMDVLPGRSHDLATKADPVRGTADLRT